MWVFGYRDEKDPVLPVCVLVWRANKLATHRTQTEIHYFKIKTSAGFLSKVLYELEIR